MTYPQPDANYYVVNGYDFFRLNTPLSSPGDIYQSPQSCQAFAIGPESDISEVVVSYFDGQQQTFMNQIVLSNERAFSARLDANNRGRYSPANRPAMIYMWPDNLWNPNFLPDGYNPTNDKLILVTPVLDVIQFFKAQTSLTPGRRDKTWTFQDTQVGGTDGDTTYIVIPYYGRKGAQISVLHDSGPQGGVDITVFGVQLTYGGQGASGATHIQTPLLTGDPGSAIPWQGIVTSGGIAIFNNDGTVDAGHSSTGGGQYDLLMVALANPTGASAPGAVFCEITVSDVPAAQGVVSVQTP